jgi:hypothetical protein
MQRKLMYNPRVLHVSQQIACTGRHSTTIIELGQETKKIFVQNLLKYYRCIIEGLIMVQ